MISRAEWRTLEPMLDELLELEPGERAAHLDGICGADPARRTRLAELLMACERGERLLLSSVESFAPLLGIPKVLGGRYRIIRELGRGGMATVYLADDARHKRHVAVKVLDPALGYAIGPKRFLMEIEIAARLQHPNILPLFDSGESDGLLFYVMPWVEGESLRHRLTRERQLPIADAVQLACEVGDALQHAHDAGVTHRDIKPGNILLSHGHALVADFGIARAISAAGGRSIPGDEGLTGPGVIVGTPEYMSPEQLRGEHQLDARTDIYSLACVAYEMLAGEPPYAGATTRESRVSRLADSVPPVRKLRDETPPAVERALSKALAGTPAGRFATASDFVEALKPPAAAPVAGRAPGPTPRPLTSAQGAAAVARTSRATLVAIAVLSAGWLVWRAFAPGPVAPGAIRSLVVLPPDNPSADSAHARLAAGLHDALITELNKLSRLAVISQTTARSYANTTKPLSRIAAELDVEGVSETSIILQRDSVIIQVRVFRGMPERLVWKGTFGGSRADMVTLPRAVARQLATSIGVPMSSREQQLLLRSRPIDPDAWELYQRGRYLLDQLNAEAVHAADSLARLAIARDPRFAEGHALLADVLVQQSYWKDTPPMDMILEAEREASRALELDSTLAMAAIRRVDLRSTYTWDWDAHDAEFQRILAGSPGSVDGHIWYGVLQATLGRTTDAVSHTGAAVRLDPANLLARNVHAMALTLDGRYGDAVAQARQILQLNPDYPVAYTRLARALVMLNQPDSAVAAMEQGYRLNRDAPLLKGQMASVYALAGHEQRARALVDTLLILRQRRWVAPTTLAEVYNALGVVDSTVTWLEEAYAVRDINLAYHLRWVSQEVRDSPRCQELLRRMNLLDRRLE
jgi:serine/threonine-protein kinase